MSNKLAEKKGRKNISIIKLCLINRFYIIGSFKNSVNKIIIGGLSTIIIRIYTSLHPAITILGKILKEVEKKLLLTIIGVKDTRLRRKKKHNNKFRLVNK